MTHAIWPGEEDLCTIEHLADVSGLSLDEVKDLVVSGVIGRADVATQPCCFHLLHVVTARQARRLRDDFGLDSNSVALTTSVRHEKGAPRSARTTAKVDSTVSRNRNSAN